MTPEELEAAKDANEALILLSDSLEKYFATLRQKNEAKAAEENFYADQFKELYDLWESDPTGEAFRVGFDEMYASNKDMVEGMVESQEILMQMREGTLSYEEGIRALTEAMRLNVIQIQKRADALWGEAQDAEFYEWDKTETGYSRTIAILQSAYDGGRDKFLQKWE